MRPRRPLRSVMLCHPRYLSAYVLGVQQTMGLRGDWHRSVSLFDDAASIARQIAEMAPDVIWTHCAAWPPAGSPGVEEIGAILATWKRRGAVVYLHDGDPRERTIPTEIDVPATFSMALLNRATPGVHWGIPSQHWPYAAMVQREMVRPCAPEWDLSFAGLLRRGDDLYSARTELVHALQARLWPRMQVTSPGGGDVNDRMLVADMVARTGAVLGFGRPEVPGWIDTRVFQIAGAGGVLIHDDAGGVLTPEEHYLHLDRAAGVEGVLRLVERAKGDGPAIRARAFAHVQRSHTWVQRVGQALAPFLGAA